MLSPLYPVGRKVFYALLFFSLLISSRNLFGQVQIWGASKDGGPDGLGTLFSLYDDGTDYQVKHSFINNPEGERPKTNLVKGSDGTYYGITSGGGVHNAGTIFKYSEANGFEKLYDLNGATDGSDARGDMVETVPGVFIGTTYSGGVNGFGVLFQYSISDGFSVMHSFSAPGGGNPSGAIAYNENNETIYGTCSSGGSNNYGTCFSYSNENGFEILHSFAGSSGGAYPRGGVILASDGKLYGTTQYGGTNSQGSIFSLDPATSTHTLLYSLTAGSSDGRYPYGNLIEVDNGVFWGTCSEGGSNGAGTVFKVLSDGTFSRLKSFQPSLDGGFPKAGLGISDTGILYGVTEFGGNSGYGTIYTITTAGEFTRIRDLDYTADGSSPVGGLISAGSGMMIGTATQGGASNKGTIFAMDETGNLTKLHDLSLPIQGAAPENILVRNEEFYGITSAGGAFNTGTFFHTSLNGTTEILHNFDPATDGQSPNGDLIKGQTGIYYGTSRFGGDQSGGTAYRISTDGEVEVIHNFGANPDEGLYPYSGVIQTNDGTLYGTTLTGGMYSDGVLYAIDPEGNYSVKHDFFGYFDGSSPEGGLTLGTNGKIYGVTKSGSTYNGGGIFEFDPASGTLMTLYPLEPTTDGQSSSRLLLHSDGYLYGTTTSGAANGGGALFRFNVDGSFELLHAFDPSADGFDPDELAEDEEGTIYGFCSQGGANNAGTCFTFTPEGVFSVIHHFSPSESPAPTGRPALFFPECYGSAGCESTNPCAVGVCNYGICEEIGINPVFSTVEIGQCEVGLDVFDLTIEMNTDINPGDSITIAGRKFAIFQEINSYTFTLTNLPANAETIDLTYSFDATGCSGTTGVLGTAPVPCPPIEVTFVLDPGDLAIAESGIHVAGNFNNWNVAANQLTENSNGFYEATVTVGSGTYQFMFFNGSSLFDAEYALGECAQNGKRQLEVGEESMTVTYCWGLCLSDCSVGIGELNSFASFSLAPNPINAGDNLSLIYPDYHGSNQFQIISLAGSVIHSGILTGQRTAISTQNLSAGMYYILIRDKQTQAVIGTQPLVVR